MNEVRMNTGYNKNNKTGGLILNVQDLLQYRTNFLFSF